MKRRTFITASAGAVGGIAASGWWSDFFRRRRKKCPPCPEPAPAPVAEKFYLGIYYDIPDFDSYAQRVQDVPTIASMRVETVYTPINADASFGPTKDFVQACKDNGLKIAPLPVGKETWAEMRQAFEGLNAVDLVEVCWLFDDVDRPQGSGFYYSLEEIQASHNAAKAAFPNVPTYVTGGFPSRAHYAAGISDLYAQQAYPFYGGNNGYANTPIQYYQEAKQQTDQKGQPLIANVQAFPGDRMPTRAELCQMSWIPCALKMSGIIWYSYHMENYTLVEAYKEIIKQVCEAVRAG